MAIGERIHFIRSLRGMTQKYLGMMVGFSEKTADVRMAQYETGARTPKADLTAELARVLDVSPSYVGLMHTLFALEDIYGLKIGEIDGEVCLRLDKSKGSTYLQLFDMFHSWREQAAKLERGEISKEEYDRWRYKYPELDQSGRWAKVPSQALSDAQIEELKKE